MSVCLKPGVLKRGRSRNRQEIQKSTNLMGVTMTMPDKHAMLDCGAALDCIGEVAAARTAQAITASGTTTNEPNNTSHEVMKSRRNPQKSEEKNGKDLWQQPCRAKGKLGLAPRRWLQRMKLHTKRFPKTIFSCTVESHESTGNEWNLLNPKIMKIALQAKVSLR